MKVSQDYLALEQNPLLSRRRTKRLMRRDEVYTRLIEGGYIRIEPAI